MRRTLGLVGLLVVLGVGCALSSDGDDASEGADPIRQPQTSTTERLPAMPTSTTQSPASTTTTTEPPGPLVDYRWGLGGLGPFRWGDDLAVVQPALSDVYGAELHVRSQDEPSGACGTFDGVWTEVVAPDFSLIFIDDRFARYEVFGGSGLISEGRQSLDLTLDELAAEVPGSVLEEHFWFGRWWRLGSGDGTEPWLYATGPVDSPIAWVSGRAPGTPGPCYD